MGGGLLALAGIFTTVGVPGVVVGGKLFSNALTGKKAVDEALDKAASEHPEMLGDVEAARTKH